MKETLCSPFLETRPAATITSRARVVNARPATILRAVLKSMPVLRSQLKKKITSGVNSTTNSALSDWNSSELAIGMNCPGGSSTGSWPYFWR